MGDPPAPRQPEFSILPARFAAAVGCLPTGTCSTRCQRTWCRSMLRRSCTAVTGAITRRCAIGTRSNRTPIATSTRGNGRSARSTTTQTVRFSACLVAVGGSALWLLYCMVWFLLTHIGLWCYGYSAELASTFPDGGRARLLRAHVRDSSKLKTNCNNKNLIGMQLVTMNS